MSPWDTQINKEGETITLTTRTLVDVASDESSYPTGEFTESTEEIQAIVAPWGMMRGWTRSTGLGGIKEDEMFAITKSDQAAAEGISFFTRTSGDRYLIKKIHPVTLSKRTIFNLWRLEEYHV